MSVSSLISHGKAVAVGIRLSSSSSSSTVDRELVDIIGTHHITRIGRNRL